jgi:hypothetical protein
LIEVPNEIADQAAVSLESCGTSPGIPILSAAAAKTRLRKLSCRIRAIPSRGEHQLIAVAAVEERL